MWWTVEYSETIVRGCGRPRVEVLCLPKTPFSYFHPSVTFLHFICLANSLQFHRFILSFAKTPQQLNVFRVTYYTPSCG
jgi:hypothetical protein